MSVSADERIQQAQVLGRIARHLLNDLLRVALARGLLRLLPIDLGLARSQNELKVHGLVVAGRVQNGFLRSLRESRELSADDITAVLRNIQLPRAGDVGGRGVALAGECVLRGDGNAGQRDGAAFDHAMQFAAGDGFGRGRAQPELKRAWTGGVCVAGACGHAARHAAKTYPTALARLIAACRIRRPLLPVLSLTSLAARRFTDAAARAQRDRRTLRLIN